MSERLRARIKRNVRIYEPTGCWLWTGKRNNGGYGQTYGEKWGPIPGQPIRAQGRVCRIQANDSGGHVHRAQYQVRGAALLQSRSPAGHQPKQ